MDFLVSRLESFYAKEQQLRQQGVASCSRFDGDFFNRSVKLIASLVQDSAESPTAEDAYEVGVPLLVGIDRVAGSYWWSTEGSSSRISSIDYNTKYSVSNVINNAAKSDSICIITRVRWPVWSNMIRLAKRHITRNNVSLPSMSELLDVAHARNFDPELFDDQYLPAILVCHSNSIFIHGISVLSIQKFFSVAQFNLQKPHEVLTVTITDDGKWRIDKLHVAPSSPAALPNQKVSVVEDKFGQGIIDWVAMTEPSRLNEASLIVMKLIYVARTRLLQT